MPDEKPIKRGRRELFDELVDETKDRREINIAMDRPGLEEMTAESWEGLDGRSVLGR